MSTQTPSIGRIVHYVAYGTPGGEYPVGAHRAAIVTAVYDNPETVDLCILNPTGLFFTQQLGQDETATRPGTWHWPERG